MNAQNLRTLARKSTAGAKHEQECIGNLSVPGFVFCIVDDALTDLSLC